MLCIALGLVPGEEHPVQALGVNAGGHLRLSLLLRRPICNLSFARSCLDEKPAEL